MKIKFKDELGIANEIKLSEEEKEIDELKVKERADVFVNSIQNVYVTFASM